MKELPPCIERTVDVEMGVKQAKVYKELVASCYAAVMIQKIAGFIYNAHCYWRSQAAVPGRKPLKKRK